MHDPNNQFRPEFLRKYRGPLVSIDEDEFIITDWDGWTWVYAYHPEQNLDAIADWARQQWATDRVPTPFTQWIDARHLGIGD